MVKRSFDILVSGIGIVALSPVLLVLASIVRLTSAGPILYRGARVGRGGRPFRICKFRSMVVNAESIGGSSTSDDDPRITSIGKFMRKCKLDELPQLFNVLWGEMSIVGPRPEVQQYVDMYTAEDQIILGIRPGITDWASIWNSDEGAILAGSDDPDRAYEELIRPTKLRLQRMYAAHHSLRIDIKLIFFTFAKLLDRDFIPAEIAHVLQSDQQPADGSAVTPTGDTGGDFGSVTELPGHGATREQLSMMRTRYRFAADLAEGKDVLELACGPGVALGYLGQRSRRVVGGDFDPSLVKQALDHYGTRFEVQQIDAQELPFADSSFDVILLLEAIYYLPQPAKFVAEARRVLRDNGSVFICTANCERPDFNPSPYTHHYFSAAELNDLLRSNGFQVDLYGGYRVTGGGIRNAVLSAARRTAIAMHLIPKTMKWKIRLKRLVFGSLQPVPAELHISSESCEQLIPLDGTVASEDYKVIYAVGRRAA